MQKLTLTDIKMAILFQIQSQGGLMETYLNFDTKYHQQYLRMLDHQLPKLGLQI